MKLEINIVWGEGEPMPTVLLVLRKCPKFNERNCSSKLNVSCKSHSAGLCGSRKYPYPITDGHWKFRGGEGF